jgi:hypothetical protein
MYSSVAFSLRDDGVCNSQSRRCQIPSDLESIESLSKKTTDSAVFHERYISPLATGFRDPNLPEKWWAQEEAIHHPYEYIGLRIQIFSTVNSINLRTVYYIESTGNPIIKWKRIIITHHLNESPLFRPHVVHEIVKI